MSELLDDQSQLIRVNKAKRALAGGEVILGVGTGSIIEPALIYALAGGGGDFIFIDLEHTSQDVSETARLVLDAHSAGLTPIVRVPEISTTWIGRVLDAGCQSIVVPGIESPEDVDKVIDAAFYHPIGRRGMGLYGGPMTSFRPVTDARRVCAAANDQLLLGLLVENQRAVSCIAELLRPEIGFVLFGASDMGQDFLWSGVTNVEEAVDSARKIVSEACRVNGTPFAIAAHSVSEIEGAVEAGASLIIHGTLLRLVQDRIRQAADELNRVTPARVTR